MRPATLEALVAGLETTADIVLCEGAMGLFDGTGLDGETGSTAELAGITGWPVILVVDARGQGASVAALLRGFAGHRPETPIAGVIFNRVSSARHARLARLRWRAFARIYAASARCCGPGAGPPRSSSRPRTGGGDRRQVDTIIDRCRYAKSAPLSISTGCWSWHADRGFRKTQRGAAPISPLGQRMAIARDEAFCFAYPALLEGWRRARC